MAYKPQVGAIMAAPNVIPMADIMLVLLIIFMVVTPMLQKGVSVDMARVQSPVDLPKADQDDAIIVAISRSGDIYLGQNKIARREDITNLVRDLISSRIDKTVFVKCDARAKYGDVVAVVDEVRSAGVDNLGLLTERSEEQRKTTPPPPTGQ
jgi:biopolymer transport protein ExbD/biopolymer transport protein TolR